MARIPQELTERIRQEVNLVELLSGYGVVLDRQGSLWTARCPFHDEKTPSFKVSFKDGRWQGKCFGACNQAFDAIELTCRLGQMGFRAAVRHLCQSLGLDPEVAMKDPEQATRKAGRPARVPVDPAAAARQAEQDARDRLAILQLNRLAEEFFCARLANHGAASAYLRQRGLDDDIVARWRIGFAPDSRHALADALRPHYPDDDAWRDAVRLGARSGLFHLHTGKTPPEPGRYRLVVPLAPPAGAEPSAAGEGATPFAGPWATDAAWHAAFRDRIVFPIHDADGNTAGFSCRIWTSKQARDEKRLGKYVNSRENPAYHKRLVLFGWRHARPALADGSAEACVVVEGQIDAIAGQALDVAGTVAACGGALTPEHCAAIRASCSRLIISMDMDKPGLNFTRKAIPLALAAGFDVRVAQALPEGFKDPGDVLKAWAERKAVSEDIDVRTGERVDRSLELVFPLAVRMAIPWQAWAAGVLDRFAAELPPADLRFAADCLAALPPAGDAELAQALSANRPGIAAAIRRAADQERFRLARIAPNRGASASAFTLQGVAPSETPAIAGTVAEPETHSMKPSPSGDTCSGFLPGEASPTSPETPAATAETRDSATPSPTDTLVKNSPPPPPATASGSEKRATQAETSPEPDGDPAGAADTKTEKRNPRRPPHEPEDPDAPRRDPARPVVQNCSATFTTNSKGKTIRKATAWRLNDIAGAMLAIPAPEGSGAESWADDIGRMGASLFAARGDEAGGEVVDWLHTPDALFAWIKTRADVEWDEGAFDIQGVQFVKRKEFYEHIRCRVRCYEAVTSRPFHPPPADTFIRWAPNPEYSPTGGALDDFIAFFNPATPADRTLLRALVLTLFWGGPPGKRPLFIIAPSGEGGSEQDIGKTSLAEAVAALAGRHMKIRPQKNKSFGDSIQKQSLEECNRSARCAIIDNTTGVLRDDDLTEVITTKMISGRASYDRQANRSNRIVWIITTNDVSFSADIASRGVIIRLAPKPADADPHWGARLDDFIRTAGRNVVDDCIAMLRDGAAHPITVKHNRFAHWNAEVLSLFPDVDACIRHIQSLSSMANADAEEIETFMVALHEHHPGVSDLSPSTIRLEPKQLLPIWEEAFPDQDAPNLSAISRILLRGVNKGMIQGLEQVKIHGKRFWNWRPSIYREKVGAPYPALDKAGVVAMVASAVAPNDF